MPYLIAEGTDESQRWRRPLPAGRAVVLGREAELTVAWDAAISRRHVELTYVNGQLQLRQLADARNPVYFRGRAVDHAALRPGDYFVIGQTRFTLLDEHAAVTVDAPQPDVQQTFTAADLRALRFSDAGSRIDVLSRLPELFAGAADDAELQARLVNVLLLGIRPATAAALVAVLPEDGVDVLHWDRRGLSRGDFYPSRRLILEAVRQQQSVLHLWRDGGGAEFTAAEQADWAFATPLPGETCRGWALFVAGRAASELASGERTSAVNSPAALRDDLKFAELVAGAVAAWRDNQRLRQRQAALKAFFSPQVLEAIGREDPQAALAPRSADVTVMFCDLRGFSRASEQQSADLMGLLDRVSRALGIATRQILEHGGVVGDFHGDAVMGFWGWPIAQPEKAALACRAALAIQSQLVEHADFRIGIGIASGSAVAGQIGTADQAKVTVFGPVVNLAARLEAMTRRLGADILLDEASAAEIATNHIGADTRRVAVVTPYGLQKPFAVSRLLPAQAERPELSDMALVEYDRALEDFIAGRWNDAHRRLEPLTSNDAAAAFLMDYMNQSNQRPPADFDGVIEMTTK